MQSASSTLIAAIAAKERQLAPPVVQADWDRDGTFTTAQGNGKPLDDLSADVESVTVRRELATDLPPGLQAGRRRLAGRRLVGGRGPVFSGAAAAAATVTLATPPSSLANPGQEHTSWKYSPFNAGGPLNGKRRMAAPAKIRLGFRTSAGLEYLDQLAGVVRTLEVDGPGRQATLELLDNVDKDFRKQLTLPMVLADDRTFGSPAQKPGLHSAWIADWVFRQCGYYVSPPARTACKMLATLHGSGWPEVGSVQEFRGQNYSRLAFPPLTPGFPTAPRWLAGVQLSGVGGGAEQIDLNMSGTASPNDGSTLLMEGWFRLDDIAHTNGSPLLQAYRTGVTEPYVVMWIDTTGRLQVSMNRAGTDNNNRSTGTTGPSGFVANTWYYVGVYLEFANANTKVWFRKDGTTTGPHTFVAGTTTTSNPMDTVAVGRGHGASFVNSELDGIVEACQVTTENGLGSPPGWNDNFNPTAVITGSKNELVAMPVVSEEAWEILKTLAAAELAMVGTTESGTPYFRDRSFFSTPPQDTSQETITTLTSVKEIRAVEDVDSVRNRWVIRANPPQVGAANSDIYSLTDYVSIPASGSKTLWVEFDDPAAYVSTSVVSHGTAGQSRYNASTAKNGAGSVVSNLTFSITVSAQSAKIVITNPNAFVVHLVGNSGVANVTQGIPSFKLVGQPVIFGQAQNSAGGADTTPGTTGVNTRIRSEASDATSITNYGERTFEFPDNPFLQDLASLDLTAADGLAYTKDPKPVVTGLQVVGNPRRQLADRVTIQDPDGLKLAGDFHLAGIETTQSADGGLAQTLDVRAV